MQWRWFKVNDVALALKQNEVFQNKTCVWSLIALKLILRKSRLCLFDFMK